MPITETNNENNVLYDTFQPDANPAASDDGMMIQKLPPKDGYKTERNRGNAEPLAK